MIFLIFFAFCPRKQLNEPYTRIVFEQNDKCSALCRVAGVQEPPTACQDLIGFNSSTTIPTSDAPVLDSQSVASVYAVVLIMHMSEDPWMYSQHMLLENVTLALVFCFHAATMLAGETILGLLHFQTAVKSRLGYYRSSPRPP